MKLSLIASLAFAACLATAGCGGHRVASTFAPGELVWPRDDPRISLRAVIDLRDLPSHGSRRILRWLGGEKQALLFQRPYAVAWDGDALLFTDPDLGLVARIDSAGRITVSSDGDFVHPIGIAACPQGIVVSDSGSGKVALLDRDLARVRWLAEDLFRPTGIGCDGARIVLVETSAHRIRMLGPDGEDRTLGRRGTAPGEFNFPSPLALDGPTLLVGDTLNFRIQRIDRTTGSSLQTFGQLGDAPGETPRIKGVAVDASGRIWVSDAILDQVSLYRSDGTLLVSVGGTGSEPGRFSFPAGIAAHPDGRVAVVDSLNLRLQIFGPAVAGRGGSGEEAR